MSVRVGRPPVDDGVRFWRFVSPCANTGCWWWTGGLFDDGYPAFKWEGATRRATRFVAKHMMRLSIDGLFVCHKCDQPTCVNPAHLFVGSAVDNMRDMLRKGRGNKPSGDRHFSRTRPETVRKGEAHPLSRLRADDVLEIRRRAACGDSQSSLASAFRVSASQIHRIIDRTRWAHI